ncbi:MAG: alpha/beta hydrolase [Candidatus Saccharibacteria bacterium]
MKIIIDDLATTYTESGSGSSILILHGWGSASSVFDDLIQTLSINHRVVALNLPGFGGSEQPRSTWGVADYSYFVTAFCKKLGIRPDILLGHSLGGQIAVHIVGNELLDPTKLILIGAAALRPLPSLRKRGIQGIAKVGKTVLGDSKLGRAAKRRLYGATGSSEYLDNPAMQPIYRKVITEDQTEVAARIDCPTLLLWGNDDTDTPVEQGIQLERLIHGSKLVVNPGGHFIFLDEAEAVQLAIKDFIK